MIHVYVLIALSFVGLFNKELKMINDDIYQILVNKNTHWDRKDSKHIYIWTSGYKTMECYEYEKLLNKAKMVCVKRRFDTLCGKTFSLYKHN